MQTMREIQQRFGCSPSWVRKMEARGLLKVAAPKAKGRIAREYTEGEVQNILSLLVLRQAGYTINQIKARNWSSLSVDESKLLLKQINKRQKNLEINLKLLISAKKRIEEHLDEIL